MSHSETKYYAHPYLTSNGMIGHTFYPYPCPESKKYELLGKAINFSIPKLCQKIQFIIKEWSDQLIRDIVNC